MVKGTKPMPAAGGCAPPRKRLAASRLRRMKEAAAAGPGSDFSEHGAPAARFLG